MTIPSNLLQTYSALVDAIDSLTTLTQADQDALVAAVVTPDASANAFSNLMLAFAGVRELVSTLKGHVE